MKPKEIVIATAVIILLSTLLNGCGLIEKSTSDDVSASVTAENQVTKLKFPEGINDLVDTAKAVTKEVKLVLDNEKSRDELRIVIKLDNPNKKPITSVQSWLSYNPDDLKGKEIDTKNSAFSLTAPYNNTFDENNGLMMLGRSNPDPVNDESITVATVIFEVLEDATLAVDAYDYREDLSGHTSVNVLVDGTPYNILVKPDSPTLLIEK